MRVVAALCWYDESPDMLSRAIQFAALAGVTDLVAVDGAYALYPDAEPVSPAEQLVAIVGTARRSGLNLSVVQPVEPWPTEVEKRTALFRHADAMTDEDAWIFVMDADYEITVRGGKGLPDVLGKLQWATVAEATLWTPRAGRVRPALTLPEFARIRCFFRGKGITVGPKNHYNYRSADGDLLWGQDTDPGLVPAANLTDVVEVAHVIAGREDDRLEAQKTYYRERDEQGIERGPCARCREPSVCFMPTDFRTSSGVMAAIGAVIDLDEGVDCDLLEFCASCMRDVAKENHNWARLHGVEPERVTKPLNLMAGALDSVR